MVTQKVTFNSQMGFHIRPAGVFAAEMQKFPCEVTLVCENNRVNGKSIMSIMAACISGGAQFEIECVGPKEEAALRRAVELVETSFR